MPPSTPFVDPATGTLKTDQILAEAIPLAKLVGAFVAVALIPFAIGFLVGDRSVFGVLFAVVGQFVLAVGAGIVLMYVIARAQQLAE